MDWLVFEDEFHLWGYIAGSHMLSMNLKILFFLLDFYSLFSKVTTFRSHYYYNIFLDFRLILQRSSMMQSGQRPLVYTYPLRETKHHCPVCHIFQVVPILLPIYFQWKDYRRLSDLSLLLRAICMYGCRYILLRR